MHITLTIQKNISLFFKYNLKLLLTKEEYIQFIKSKLSISGLINLILISSNNNSVKANPDKTREVAKPLLFGKYFQTSKIMGMYEIPQPMLQNNIINVTIFIFGINIKKAFEIIFNNNPIPVIVTDE